MKIVIDARMYQESGIGRYIRNLIDNLNALDRENEYFIFHRQPEYDTLVYHTNFHKVLANFKWYGVREQIELPKILGKLKPDLVHFPHFNVPVFYRGKFVVTIHDLIHQHFSMQRATAHGPLLYKLKNFGYKKVFQHAINKSLKILVPSNFVKKQLTDGWRVDRRKIIVTPEAVNDKILEKSQEVLESRSQRAPYIFYVGNAHPHKNVEGLIKVFLVLKEKYADLLLVLAGYDHYFWKRIKAENQYKDIIYTGAITDEELVALYKNAQAFVLPSFEEGFGIPLLEAMACGCPVVSSNAGALPQVGGDAVLYFDPYDEEDMENKVNRVLKDESLRKNLVSKGLKRAKLFSWRKLAEQTLEVYTKCV